MRMDYHTLPDIIIGPFCQKCLGTNHENGHIIFLVDLWILRSQAAIVIMV